MFATRWSSRPDQVWEQVSVLVKSLHGVDQWRRESGREAHEALPQAKAAMHPLCCSRTLYNYKYKYKMKYKYK